MKRAALFLATTLCLSAAPLRAQDESVPQPPKAAAAPTEGATLQDGLAQLDWDPARRGPLLLIAPEKAKVKGRTLPPPRGGYGLPELLGYVDQQLVRFPSLTSAGPNTMVVLSTPTVSSFRGMSEFFRQGEPRALLESLDAAQLNKALSAGGLGYADLTSEHQRGLWAKMLPYTLTFQETPGPFPAALGAGQSPWWGNQKIPVLSPAAQRNLRLRVSLDLTLTAKPGGYEVGFTERTGGAIQVALRALPQSPDDILRVRQEQEKLSSTQTVPYRRKLSDLDTTTERFTTPISLTEVKTVGELVQRVAKAVNLELYADPRIAVLPVFVKALPDQSVTASDALGAVLRATCFTIRRLSAGRESAFVVTFDRVPLGNQSVALFDTMMPQLLQEMQNQMSEQKASSEASQKLRKKNLLKLLTRGEGAEAPEFLWSAALGGKSEPVPLASLPGSLQTKAQAIWTRVQAYKYPDGTPPPPRPEALLPRAQVRVFLSGEGLGRAELASLQVKELLPPEPPPLVSLPPTMKTRSLLVNPPREAASAKKLIALAKERGFNQLVVALSGDANDDLAVSLLTAEKDALPVLAMLSPITPAPTDTLRERDLSVTGRTALEMAQGRTALGELSTAIPFIRPLFEQITKLNALTPEAVPVERVASRVLKLTSLPGVAGVVFQGLKVPGYEQSFDADSLESLWTGGYTASERLAFLRAKGADPADFLQLEGVGGSVALPFFGGGRDETRRLWNERRKQRGELLRKRLDTALQAAKVTKPIWQLETRSVMDESGVWKPWKPGLNGPVQLAHWQALSQRMPFGGGDEAAAALDDIGLARLWLAQRLKRSVTSEEEGSPFPNAVGPAGFVLDLTDLTFSESLALIEAVVAKAPAP